MHEQPAVGGDAGPAARPASASTASSATWMCTPTPRSAASPRYRLQRLVGQGEAGVGADVVAATRDAEVALVLGQPGSRAVEAVAVGDLVAETTRTPTSVHASCDDVERCPRSRWATRGGRRSTVVPALERLERAEHAPTHRIISRSRARVEPPPDQFEDLGEGASACVAVRACPAPAPSRGGGAPQPSPGWCAPFGHPHASAPRAARIGSRARHSPSRSCSAAATAPAVGTSPISPTPLMPYGDRGCGSSTRMTSIGRHVLGPHDAERPQRHVRRPGRRRRAGSPRDSA